MALLKSILFIIAIWFLVFFSGCVGEKNIPSTSPTPVINETPAINTTPAATPVITNVTPAPSAVVPEPTPAANATRVILDSRRGFIPDIQTITKGDEMFWINYDTSNVTLVSKDGLFSGKSLAYYQQYRYVFNRIGNYTFSLENENLNGTIIVVSSVIPSPVPSSTPLVDLPPNALYVTARMKKLSNWSSENEIKYELKWLRVNIQNQQSIPLSIKAQIMSGSQVIEEKSFVLEKLDSNIEFMNEKDHFINSKNVILRLLPAGYKPVSFKFIEVDDIN